MKRKQAAAACLMAATMLFSGCTPNIREYAARAQQAGKHFFEGETTDVMAQDGADVDTQDTDTTAATDDETQFGATEATADNATKEADADSKTSASDDSAANETQSGGSTTTDGGETQHGGTETTDASATATGETQTDTVTESAAATAPQIPALMTEVTDSVYEAYAQKADAFTGKLAGHDRLSRAENAALAAPSRAKKC